MIKSDAADSNRPSPSFSPKGRIITFYSYKGGSGRSMAVANVGWMLAMNGFRVVIIDWDLEAPGIHRYFHPFLEDKDLKETPGLLDMVEALAASSAASAQPLSSQVVDVVNYIEPLEWPRNSPDGLSWKSDCFKPRGRIDLLPAGRQGPSYSRKLNAFNWIDFYERLGGRSLLNAARTQLQSIYDYVLIDSRTGVSDTSGICTVELPDTLVVCFTLNDQSILGAAAVTQSIRDQRAARSFSVASPRETQIVDPNFRIFPIPTRVEITSERQKREAALEVARKSFAFLMPAIGIESEAKYWGAAQMAYFPFYAFEEIPAAFGDKPDEALSLSTSIRYLTQLIVGPDVGIHGYAPLGKTEDQAENLRQEVIRWYLRPIPAAKRDSAEAYEDLYQTLNDQDRSALQRLLLRLIVVGNTTMPSARIVDVEEVGDSVRLMVHRLTDDGLLRTTETRGRGTIELADSSVVQRWNTLRNWIDKDRPFLVWRLGLDAAAESWKGSSKEESSLLRGTALRYGLQMLAERKEDLNNNEREYIETSHLASRSDQPTATQTGSLRTIFGFQRSHLVLFTTLMFFAISAALSMFLWQQIQTRNDEAAKAERLDMTVNELERQLETQRRLLEDLQSNPIMTPTSVPTASSAAVSRSRHRKKVAAPAPPPNE